MVKTINKDRQKAEIAGLIAKGMKAKSLNNLAFSKLMGVQPSVITKWLGGKQNFTIETLFDIEDVLGIKIINITVPNFEIKLFYNTDSSAIFEVSANGMAA
jgi:transcriptional regulator with XRE-family HTH domain